MSVAIPPADFICNMTSGPSPLQVALQLAEVENVPVFPCNKDKRPYTEHGFKDATKNRQQIEDWWLRYPDALVAVPTGGPSHLLVIDIDPNGADWYREHQTEMAAGLTHATPRRTAPSLLHSREACGM